ncbi:MAG: hypothetical protein GEU90_02130 [Gemmatimonas sp.]|nr:hypothetical protein [Gemmatimonas sp.]
MSDLPPDAPGGGHGTAPPGEKVHLFDRPENVRSLFWALYAICAVLFLADFFVERHVVHPWESLPDFYPIYGFVGIVVLVLLAKQLRRLVMKDRGYYDAG